ncbi:SpaH/EbpB family LPXTG-anchored major pilin [Corynebacterium comes]|uniref:Fimbrial subunit type 1 n=1 Tax=Corynebacterium comes TaxID=2675218 RepID=A0A6B8VXM1_9CORY|nr:SpaH/EbpB family LPXTG-anchored major pilin [Corynebacterium comes]QGU03745.1 Fimbrial subunit type 1 precursor [Corynebacterium comes]
MTTRVQRSAAVVAAFGIALSTAAIGAPAFALETVTPVTVPGSNVDPATDTSLTIKKYLNPTSVGTPTGNTGDSTFGDLVEGIQFTVTEILDADGNSIDMTDNGIFQTASRLQASDFAGGALPIGYTLGSSVSVTTDANGTAVFTTLGQGVFLVEETSTAGAKVGGIDVSGSITPSAPFIAFLPMTKVTTGGSIEWNYNPIAYPKNSSQTATKAVDDDKENVGDTIKYTITTDIPNQVDNTRLLNKYVITDTLDLRLTPPAEGDVTVALSTGPLDAGDYIVDVTGQVVTVTFTVDGLETLRANQDAQVITMIPSVINSAGAPNGESFNPISNSANLTTNNGTSGDIDTPTNAVDTKIGKLQIEKINANDELLSGAEFELYRCTTAGVLDGAALTVGGQSKWTTVANNPLVINGLHITDFTNNVSGVEAYKYCLVETKAPQGYELLAEPVVITFTQDAVQSLALGDDAQTKVVEIENVASVSSQLPSTGGMGVGLLIAAGVGLVGAGAYAAKRNSDKSDAAEA